MRNLTRIFLTIIIGFTIISSACSQHKNLKKGNYPTVGNEFTLTMTDGTILDCTKFTPSGVPPVDGWPSMVFCHGYGGSKNDMLAEAQSLSSTGYFTVCYSMRGQGVSGGLSNLISTTEMYDFIAVVTYVKAEPNINVNKVGANGSSQGGTIPLMAVCNNPGLLRCVISDVSSPELGSDWIGNNSVKMTLLWTLSYVNTVARYNDQVKAYRNWILADTPEKFDSLNFYMPLNRDFANKIVQNTTPLIVSTVWQDKFFNSYAYLKNLSSFANPSRFYMGSFGAHGSEFDSIENNYHNSAIINWADYYLGAINNGAPDSVRFTYAASSYPRNLNKWTWRRFNTNTWPPAGVNDVKFYFHPSGVINNNQNTTQPDNINFVNAVDPTLTMTEAVNYEFTGVFNTKFIKSQLTFETNPLAADAIMIGTPFVNLHYIPDTNIAQFNLQIYEIKTGTTPYLIGRANFTDRKVTSGVLKQISFHGTSHSHIFQTGSKIRVVITNLDNISNDPFLRTNPYVLPSLKSAVNKIYMSSANPSYIQLPLIGYVNVGVNPITSQIPSSIELGQNYPNPFNPSTNIKFSIPQKYNGSFVTLKVYDIKGREIQTLVNENLNAGVYETKFDGSKLFSGVYFYTLLVNDFKETKRLILVK